MSVLKFAIQHASIDHRNNATQTRIVALLLDHHSQAQDAEMICALQMSSAEVVELLLRHWPDGETVLKSSSTQSEIEVGEEISRGNLSAFFQQDFEVGPLWYVARRQTLLYVNDDAELVDLFVRRGEDINTQCGPVGTALHSAMLPLNFGHTSYRSCSEYTTMWNLLLAKGADINAKGPLGTPLEFVWRLGNTGNERFYRGLRWWSSAIQWLIENGAVNDMRDPNGSVPTREQMLSFGVEGIRQSQRLYRGDADGWEGDTSSSADEWETCTSSDT